MHGNTIGEESWLMEEAICPREQVTPTGFGGESDRRFSINRPRLRGFGFQASLRDAGPCAVTGPGVETPGYHHCLATRGGNGWPISNAKFRFKQSCSPSTKPKAAEGCRTPKRWRA